MYTTNTQQIQVLPNTAVSRFYKNTDRWDRIYKLKLKDGLNQVYSRGKYLYEILESEPNSHIIELFRYNIYQQRLSIFNNLLKAHKILQQIQIQTQIQHIQILMWMIIVIIIKNFGMHKKCYHDGMLIFNVDVLCFVLFWFFRFFFVVLF